MTTITLRFAMTIRRWNTPRETGFIAAAMLRARRIGHRHRQLAAKRRLLRQLTRGHLNELVQSWDGVLKSTGRGD